MYSAILAIWRVIFVSSFKKFRINNSNVSWSVEGKAQRYRIFFRGREYWRCTCSWEFGCNIWERNFKIAVESYLLVNRFEVQRTYQLVNSSFKVYHILPSLISLQTLCLVDGHQFISEFQQENILNNNINNLEKIEYSTEVFLYALMKLLVCDAEVFKTRFR